MLRKLPVAVGRAIDLASLLVAMLRLRGDKEFWGCLPYRRLLKRTIHLFCQGAEEGMACQLLEECPIPELAAKYHPYMRASRRRGNKTLEMGLVNKFMCRGGGFVSTKHETHLADLGLMTHRAALGQRTAAEYVARHLTKQRAFIVQTLDKQDLKTINLCLDGATVCSEQACISISLHVSLSYWRVLGVPLQMLP